MTIQTNTTDRKALAKAIADRLGTEAKYMGPPTFGYQIGDFTIDRDGNLTGEDFEALRDFLQENGILPEDEGTLAEEQTEPETTDLVDTDQVNITVPADDLTPLQLKNLIMTLYVKQYLISKMVGGDLLNIPDALAARLVESTPETIEDFLPLLEDAKENGMTGFEFADGKVTITFPMHQDEPERNMVYAMLTARILKAAKEATRVFPERQEPENEKYYARAWLLRLGYGGADSKAERNLLLKHLKGHSAFPNDDAANRHKEKYAAIRRERRQAAQETEEVASDE